MIQVDLVTPYRKIVEGANVKAVTLPSQVGELEVLPGHCDLVTELAPGRLSFELEGARRHFAVSYGFCQVSNDKVIVLAETCEEAHEIDYDRATAAQKSAEDALINIVTQDQLQKYQLKLRRAMVRKEIAEKK